MVWLALRSRTPRVIRMVGETLTTSAQLGVRVGILLCILLVWVATAFDLDFLLGAFTAGIILRLFLASSPREEVEVLESKLEAVGFGFLVPIFFVMSGVRLDLQALVDQPLYLLLLPVALAAFLLVRGGPVLWLYRPRARRSRRQGARAVLRDRAAAGRGDDRHRGGRQADVAGHGLGAGDRGDDLGARAAVAGRTAASRERRVRARRRRLTVPTRPGRPRDRLIGELLPYALGVAISPVPIIATILMLLAPKAGGTSVGFLVGWVLGITGATVVFLVIAETTGLDAGSDPSTTSSWIKLVLGVLLLLLAVRQWRGRPKGDEPATLPTWMSAIDSFTLVRALLLGFALAAINPKNLLMCIAAGSALGGSDLSSGDVVVATVVFIVLASSTVAVPVLGYAVAKERMRQPLDELKVWLQANNVAVMSVLLLVIGVVLVGKGLAGL